MYYMNHQHITTIFKVGDKPFWNLKGVNSSTLKLIYFSTKSSETPTWSHLS